MNTRSQTPRYPRRARPSTAPSSARRSAHSDITSKQHAIDKREQDKRKKSNWLRLEEVDDLPAPDCTGTFWGDKKGVSYRWIAGMPAEVPPSELFQLREKLRRENQTYRGRMIRKSKDGSERECWVPRPLLKPLETTNLTLPPWTQASIKSAPLDRQKVLIKRITTRVCKIAEKTKREVVGVDVHGDTDKLHLELHTLKINKKTGRIIDMPCTTTWHLGQDRLFRHGLEDPKAEERTWREAADGKKGLTVDLEMSRAIDEEVDRWLIEQGRSAVAETELRRQKWVQIANRAKEKRILEKGLSKRNCG